MAHAGQASEKPPGRKPRARVERVELTANLWGFEGSVGAVAASISHAESPTRPTDRLAQGVAGADKACIGRISRFAKAHADPLGYADPLRP